MKLDEGEVVSLLGRNGAGKTTTLRSIVGLTHPRSGSVEFMGSDVSRREPFQISRMGIGFVPEDRRIFPDLTTRENLEIARRAPQKGEPWTVDRVHQLFPSLKDLDGRRGMYLSGGEQKMLAIGRALMGNPQLLLLDEPSEGLAPIIVGHLLQALKRIRDEGISILFADQNVKFAKAMADRGYIMEKGAIRYEDDMGRLWQNQEIVRKYLAV